MGLIGIRSWGKEEIKRETAGTLCLGSGISLFPRGDDAALRMLGEGHETASAWGGEERHGCAPR